MLGDTDDNPAGSGQTGPKAGRQLNLRFETAEDLFAQLPDIEDDMTARPTHQREGTVAFIEALVASATPEEAITFTAYALPRRHAVWWGHECLRQGPGKLDETDHEMLQLAEAWVTDPSEVTRYAALDAAMEAEAKTAGVWIALGAGWSGGSMVPSDYQPVAPPPFLTARAVNAGVLSVLARADVKERQKILSDFVQMAMVIINDD